MMFGEGGSAKVFVATRPVDFRKGIDGLALAVREDTSDDHIQKMVEMLAEQIPDAPAGAAREQAMAALATMVGTLVLARAGGSGKLSDDILAAGRDALLEKPAPGKARAKKPATKGA